MHILTDGASRHLFTSDPADWLASPGVYVGTVVVGPSETPNTDELLKRLGVRSTPFEYDFDDDAGALGAYLISRAIPDGARVVGGHYKVETTFTAAADAAVVGIGINAENDLKAAEAIAAAAAWDAAAPVQLPATTQDSVLLTADRQVVLSITTAVVTGGKLRGSVEWTFDDAITGAFTAE